MTGLPPRAAAPRRLVPRQRAPFDRVEALRFAEAAWALPPARPHIVRPPLRGEVVARFVLPLELCPPLNAFAEMPSWKRKKIKDNALACMLGQSRRRWPEPLSGRPCVVAVRFSSVEPDGDSGWQKVPVDRLTVKREGLGLIRDDRGTAIERVTWWEPARRDHGFVLIEVRGDARDEEL